MFFIDNLETHIPINYLKMVLPCFYQQNNQYAEYQFDF